MQYQYLKPHALLQNFVRTVLVVEGFAPSSHNQLPFFTNGMPALFCRIAMEPNEQQTVLQLTLFGSSTPTDSWEVKNNETIIAFFFKPFTLPTLFNLSAANLAKKPVDLFDWNVHKTNALRVQLACAGTTLQKKDALSELLLHLAEQRKNECRIILTSTDRILYDWDKNVLAALLTELNLNERTFQRLFKKHVGISPNQYRRICQFQQSFSQVKSGSFDSLTEVAFTHGFADQSHFIRSFKEFTEVTPKDYIKTGLKTKNR